MAIHETSRAHAIDPILSKVIQLLPRSLWMRRLAQPE